MIVKLVEIYEDNMASFASRELAPRQYSLREVFVNPEHVVLLRPDLQFNKKSDKVLMPEGLRSEQEFTIIYINKGHSGLEIIVVGEPSAIEEKLNVANKRILKG